MSQHNKPRPLSGFRAAFMRVVAVLIGFVLLLFVYYYIRYDFLPKDLYTSHIAGKVAGFGVVLTLGTLWYWLNGWRRSRRK